MAEGGWTPLAGGTDIYPACVGRPVDESLLDLSGLQELRSIDEVRDAEGLECWRIGALATWSAIDRARLAPQLFALQQAAREIGGSQIQNQATIGGNLCNASPAADGIPALLALDARVELASTRGTRVVPLAEFVLGNRRTALGADELLVAISVPRRAARTRSRFLKLGHRRYLVISIVMAAATVEFGDDERIAHCAIAIGACSAAAVRLHGLESRLLHAPRAGLAERVATLLDEGTGVSADAGSADAGSSLAPPTSLAPLTPLRPIDDVRGTAAYRRHAAGELLRRLFAEFASTAART